MATALSSHAQQIIIDMAKKLDVNFSTLDPNSPAYKAIATQATQMAIKEKAIQMQSAEWAQIEAFKELLSTLKANGSSKQNGASDVYYSDTADKKLSKDGSSNDNSSKLLFTNTLTPKNIAEIDEQIESVQQDMAIIQKQSQASARQVIDKQDTALKVMDEIAKQFPDSPLAKMNPQQRMELFTKIVNMKVPKNADMRMATMEKSMFIRTSLFGDDSQISLIKMNQLITSFDQVAISIEKNEKHNDAYLKLCNKLLELTSKRELVTHNSRQTSYTITNAPKPMFGASARTDEEDRKQSNTSPSPFKTTPSKVK